MGDVLRKLVFLFHRRQRERDLDEEMRYHAEMAGKPQFGNLTLLQEQSRGEWGFTWLSTFFQDLRLAFRLIGKSPGFSAVIVLTLALGIGANTMVFSVIRAVLLRPLPYGDAGRLVLVTDSATNGSNPEAGLSYPGFTELRDSSIFRATAGLAGHSLVLTGSGDPAEVRSIAVTSDFFSVLSAHPKLGRSFMKSDDEPGAAGVVLLSDSLWRSRFGADPNIVGHTLNLDMRPYTVIGVMPASFHTPFFNQASQLWIPLAQDPLFSVWMTRPPQQHWMAIIASIRSGISSAELKTELDGISRHLAGEYPYEREWAIRTKNLQSAVTGEVRLPLLVLFGAVGLLLLIACVNVANLLLSRATSRWREIAIRIALGARAGRIASQLLTEYALLGLLGCIVGTLLAYFGLACLKPLLPADLPEIGTICIDESVLAFSLGLAFLTSVLFGLAPIIFALRQNPNRSLADRGRTGEASGPRRMRALLAICEISLAFVLLTGAGLLIRSLARLTAVNPGFETSHVVKATVSLPQFQYTSPKQWGAFSDEFVAKLQSQPGMENAAIAGPLPITDCCIRLAFQITGKPQEAGSSDTANYVPVSPRYFAVMGIPLQSGRLFKKSDTASSAPVTLISHALAKRYFVNENALGKYLSFGFPANGITTRQIVGIVGDVRDESLGKDPGPMLYIPFAQAPLYGGEVVVKSTLDESSIAGAIRRVAHSIDKNLPVTNIAQLPEILNESTAQPKFRTWLLALFSGIAFVLAGIGIFGVIAYSVSRRTQELGLRMALGAQPASIARLIMRETTTITLIGIAIGLPCAIAAAHVLKHLLFQTTPYDPVTLPLVSIALLALALAASYVPARRAVKVDPVIALRYE